MKVLSVCSGIGTEHLAWGHLGWRVIGHSEIDRFACAVLDKHYPQVKNYGSLFDQEQWEIEKADIIVGGTPCQTFSVAGFREGLSDERGNLAIQFCRLVGRIRPKWFVWENVPGVLSVDSGRAFGSILRAMDECGYGVSWRILDAQSFGLPQHRRRLFLVGYLGDWRPAAAVFFDEESGGRIPAAGEGERTSGNPASEGTGRCVGKTGKIKMFRKHGFMAGHREANYASTLKARGGRRGTRIDLVLDKGRVRYQTPVEYERLQGIPDNYTRVPYTNGAGKAFAEEDCPMPPRYKAIGNSIAVPVLKWVGDRINHFSP